MQDLTAAEFNKIRDYIKSKFGIALSDEKKTLVHSRLRSTLQELDMSTFSEYFDYLMKDKSGDALTRFVNKITTNHTFFMRETDHFDYFRDEVLPYVEEKYSAQRDARVWCAASSSGEEAVTLQILLQEYFKKTPGWDTQMLASDISAQVLDRAVAGKYATEALENLPKTWKNEYFDRVDGQFSKVKDSVLKRILYRRINLMDPFPFKKKMQVIFCRNVMIYFDNETRNGVVKRFFEITEPGGYLFIGHSESISNAGSGYQYIKPAVYRKPL
ncbi:MAG: protein-glutamate O-methyltransferase CheR [Defluviitaleaceae bacterium]|nr:protein-glutamate O-methyltransferase CheR [Defluviitaleaceae bacterium]MCL2262169.1 protein-glutamate O-methyltransferase CheR [Defluviitaleaceae bacterium]